MELFDQVVEKLVNATPVKGGEYYRATCPFHEEVTGHSDENPSMLVYREWFVCKSCDTKGPLKKLLTRLEAGTNDIPTLHEKTLRFPWYKWPDLTVLAHEAHQRLLSREELQTYLVKRGIQDRIESCQIGYADGFYIFPAFDRRHRVVGVVTGAGPALRKKFQNDNKYIVSPGFKDWLVPDWRLIGKSDKIFIAYGVMDTYTLSHLRIPCAYWATGKSVSAELLKTWKDKRWIYHIPDKGEKIDAILNANLGGYNHKVIELAYPNGLKDPNGFSEHHREKDLQVQLSKYL